MNGLGEEVAKDANVKWIIEELEAGSATTTIRGEADTAEDLGARDEIIEAYEPCRSRTGASGQQIHERTSAQERDTCCTQRCRYSTPVQRADESCRKSVPYSQS